MNFLHCFTNCYKIPGTKKIILKLSIRELRILGVTNTESVYGLRIRNTKNTGFPYFMFKILFLLFYHLKLFFRYNFLNLYFPYTTRIRPGYLRILPYSHVFFAVKRELRCKIWSRPAYTRTCAFTTYKCTWMKRNWKENETVQNC